jgi:hypothetical protein
MPLDVEAPRRPRRTERDDTAIETPSPPPGPLPRDFAPPRPAVLTEGLEITICLADLPPEDGTPEAVTDRLWALSAGSVFEVAAVHPQPGGARLHFLVRDGGPGGDAEAVLDLLRRVGAHYRWVAVTRLTCGAAPACRQ